MKYYRLHNQTDKIDDKYWPHMVANEPTVEQLTKQEYENSRGIKSKGKAGKDNKNVGQSVGPDSKKENEAPVSIESTKREIIAEIQKRGVDIPIGKLNQKNKQQLLELL